MNTAKRAKRAKAKARAIRMYRAQSKGGRHNGQ